MRAVRLAALSMLATGVAQARMPPFSWDTVPRYIHMCNESGLFNADALTVIGNFSMGTIEKGQSLNGPGNATTTAEERILSALKQIRTAHPDMYTIAYFNSQLSWTYYALNAFLASNDALRLKNASGGDVVARGDPSFPQPQQGMWIFNHASEDMRALYANACSNLTATGFVDGCFADRANYGASFSHNTLTPAQLQAFEEGHLQAMQLTQQQLGDSLLIANNQFYSGITGTMLESFGANEESILMLMNASAAAQRVQAHAGYAPNGQDNYCQDVTNSLSAFLIGAGENCYYACSRGWAVNPLWPAASDDWLTIHPQYLRPLGAPSGPAVKHGDTYTRSFASGTVVTFNTTSNEGRIAWAS